MITLPGADGTEISWLTSRELCEDVLHWHKSTLAKHLREGSAPSGSFILGRERLWPAESIREWMIKQQNGVAVQ
jgi:hypothetical protein